ncbi:MAG: hypothetical protein GEV03_11820 [Streptosporangiales bacterium]|nr:hypothetical protein [Streptosporangiales bacterium]
MVVDEPDAAEAAATLTEAERIHGIVRRRGSWYVYYQVIYGVMIFTATLILGMFPSWWSPAVVAVGCFGLGLAGVFHSRRQPVAVRDGSRNLNVATAVSLPVYLAVCFVGLLVFEQNLAWWLPGAAAAAMPPFVYAYREARR